MNGLNFDRINPQFNSKLRQLNAYYFKRGNKVEQIATVLIEGKVLNISVFSCVRRFEKIRMNT